MVLREHIGCFQMFECGVMPDIRIPISVRLLVIQVPAAGQSHPHGRTANRTAIRTANRTANRTVNIVYLFNHHKLFVAKCG